MGIGVRPVAFATLEAEGGWIGRDFAAPGGSGRATLTSRAATVGVRLHHPVLGLEPSAFGGVSFLRSSLEVPSSAGVDVETATSTGLAAGLGLDLPLGSSLAVGLDWRYLWATATLTRLGGGSVALGGHALGCVVRLFWP
jgi:opacity protein-like surface antigen